MDDAKTSTEDGVQEVTADNIASVFGLESLPEEICELIAKMVLEQDSKDHQNLINASQYFQNLRAPKRTAYLFEDVLPLVAVSLWEKQGLHGFPVKDVLNCRLVCKAWDAAIQKIVPEKFDISGKSYFGKGSSSRRFQFIGKKFEKIQWREFKAIKTPTDNWTVEMKRKNEKYSAKRFLNSFPQALPKGQRINPFLCRHVQLHFRIFNNNYTCPEFHQFLRDVLLMLKPHRRQIETLDLLFTDMGITFEFSVLQLVPRLLGMIPNLKTFQFTEHGRRGIPKDMVMIPANLYREFPKSEHLEKIEIRSRPLPTFYQIIKTNSHVQELWVEWPDKYLLFLRSFPNLKKLTLVKCEEDIVEELSTPQVKDWPVETLVLDQVKFEGDFGQLAPKIQAIFANTLVYLKVNGRKVWEGAGQ